MPKSTGGDEMRTEYKVVLLSVFFGLVVWIIDAALDYSYFYKGSFIGLLILDTPPHELYIRLLIVGCFLIFGVIISRFVKEIDLAEKSLRQANYAMEGLLNATTDMVLLLDTEGVVRLTNKHGAKLLVPYRSICCQSGHELWFDMVVYPARDGMMNISLSFRAVVTTLSPRAVR